MLFSNLVQCSFDGYDIGNVTAMAVKMACGRARRHARRHAPV
jgi:hypothetical protein